MIDAVFGCDQRCCLSQNGVTIAQIAAEADQTLMLGTGQKLDAEIRLGQWRAGTITTPILHRLRNGSTPLRLILSDRARMLLLPGMALAIEFMIYQIHRRQGDLPIRSVGAKIHACKIQNLKKTRRAQMRFF